MTTDLDTSLDTTIECRSPEDDLRPDGTTRAKLSTWLAVTFTSFLLGMAVLSVAADTMEPKEQALTGPSASQTPAKVRHNPESDRTVKELEARRNGAFREAERLNERISKLRTSRVEQLEAELTRARWDLQGGNQRIKELEDDRFQATRETRKALKKLVEELGS